MAMVVFERSNFVSRVMPEKYLFTNKVTKMKIPKKKK